MRAGLGGVLLAAALAHGAPGADFHRIFRERCDICHGRARDFARLRLIVREGRLTGRYSGRDIEAFLPGHARMTAEEARRMLEALTAILSGAR